VDYLMEDKDLQKTGRERRKYKRIEKALIAKFKSVADSGGNDVTWNMVTLKNISAGGMLFNFDKKLQLHGILDIQINFPALKNPVKCRGKVLRVDKIVASLYGVAVLFTKLSNEDKNIINRKAEEFYSKKEDIVNF